LDATIVILLFDPEFLTAANFRKRYLLAIKANDNKFMKHAEVELNFITGILASPLFRQSKSPTLWHHRYWLAKVVNEHIAAQGKKPFWTSTRMDDELLSIFSSAQHHPNNYYAWQHGRNMIILYSKLENDGKDLDLLEAPPEFVDKVLQWCLKHPSDTSGWSFLLYLLTRTQQKKQILVDTIMKVMEFAQQTRYDKVALWHFVRTLYVSHACVDTVYKYNILDMIPQFRRTGGVVPLNGRIMKPGKLKDDWNLFISQ
jgi:hypothetical protein